jgi:hypothetical protein
VTGDRTGSQCNGPDYLPHSGPLYFLLGFLLLFSLGFFAVDELSKERTVTQPSRGSHSVTCWQLGAWLLTDQCDMYSFAERVSDKFTVQEA